MDMCVIANRRWLMTRTDIANVVY
eukprot:COSAG01_NODE_55387_length_325_cov_0.915929_2_plen_23_part_01